MREQIFYCQSMHTESDYLGWRMVNIFTFLFVGLAVGFKGDIRIYIPMEEPL